MATFFAILAFFFAIVSLAYLQLPTFLLMLGYRWFYHYKLKRWIFRILALISFTLFLFFTQTALIIILVSIPLAFLLIMSLLNANPKVYIALREHEVLKLKEHVHLENIEVLGYVDEADNAICYPLLELVKPRHLLNDTFMKKPLFVSYCMACRSAMVYNPVVDNLRLHFEVLGVYRRNMVMSDLETGTIWQQGTGEAVYGKLKGKQLVYLPYQMMTINEWLKLYPNSLIAAEADTVRDGLFSKDRLMKMMKITERLVAPGQTDLSGLPLREQVYGVVVNGYSKAYPITELNKTESTFSDKIGPVEVLINYNKSTNFIEVKDVSSGETLTAQSHWWFGWKEFHPKTEIWKFE